MNHIYTSLDRHSSITWSNMYINFNHMILSYIWGHHVHMLLKVKDNIMCQLTTSHIYQLLTWSSLLWVIKSLSFHFSPHWWQCLPACRSVFPLVERSVDLLCWGNVFLTDTRACLSILSATLWFLAVEYYEYMISCYVALLLFSDTWPCDLVHLHFKVLT